MRLIIMLAVACTGITLARPADADTLRCGSVLIRPGDDAFYVLEKCLEPAAAVALARSGWMAGVDSNVYPLGFTQLQRWRISRGPGKFPALLTIGADGRVETIEFGRRRD
jgi:Protein of unknown function (DUF2845)